MRQENAKFEIVKYPHPILRQKCEEVREITAEVRNLCQQMKRIMIENRGIGLAASQIGELKRIILVQTEKGIQVCLNPVIVKESEETILMEEGCLSFPGLFLKIRRAAEVEIEFLNLKGEKIKRKAKNLEARIFQHEIDHLNGILFIDRTSCVKRLLIKSKYHFKK